MNHAYDTGVVHAGLGTPHISPPYPLYLTERVFVLLASAGLDPSRIAKHRADNQLSGRVDLTIENLF